MNEGTNGGMVGKEKDESRRPKRAVNSIYIYIYILVDHLLHANTVDSKRRRNGKMDRWMDGMMVGKKETRSEEGLKVFFR